MSDERDILNQPCQFLTLAECVENYMADRTISKKKYFKAYLQMAKKEWQLIFRRTLWSTQTRWQTLKQLGDRYYIDIPSNASIVFSVAIEDHCKLLQPLYYNNQLSVVDKPAVRKCGCQSATCECGGLCQDVNSMSMETKLVFEINGIPYYEKIWYVYCPNGDILQYREVPTKSYNTIAGDGGDFNDDYNPDYDIASQPFTDYAIITSKFQKKICTLEVLECGCPRDTNENAIILSNACGCNLNIGCGTRRRHCKNYFENPNGHKWGEVKISECGTKIYFRPSRHWQSCTNQTLPEFLQLNFQTNGLEADQEVLVPDFAIDAMETGIDDRRIKFNTKFSLKDRDYARFRAVDERNKVIALLNPIDLIFMDGAQDLPVRW